MFGTILARSMRYASPISRYIRPVKYRKIAAHLNFSSRTSKCIQSRQILGSSLFHTSASGRAQGPSADALMETLTDLYATAKDEFEIAAEETEKNTTYAQDDRTAARDALNDLKIAFEKALRESDPDVAKEVTSRVGQRIRELDNAVTALEESAVEH